MIIIKAFYIKEDDKPNIVNQFINHIKVKDNYIIIQPIKESTDSKQLYKTTRKIKKICVKNNVHDIVISKKLQKNKEFYAYTYSHNINIFDGKWLWKYMAYETIDFILQKTHSKKEETEISILVNNVNNEVLENIKLFVKEFKRINIVTNRINEFKYLEKKIYDEYGMLMLITNNKRKSLEKAKLILNFDFSNEIINQYNIYENSIIINFKYDIKIKKKRFNGLIVNNYDVTCMRENDFFEFDKLRDFYLRDLLEAKLYRKDTFQNIRHDVTKDYYKIKELYGMNGKVL